MVAAAASGISPAVAEEPLPPATYSTGEAGHPLKWLQAPAPESEAVVPASAIETAAATMAAEAELVEEPAAKTPPAPPADDGALAPAERKPSGDFPCLKPSKAIRAIRSISLDIAPPAGILPADCPIAEGAFVARSWSPTTFRWTASALCHKPLYFEDEQVERYGHSWGPVLQPILSGVHFFATVPALPYLIALNPPQECIYTLGYYRPGNCAPYMFDPIPLSVRSALVEGGVVAGLILLIP